MESQKTKIDITYIAPGSTFIYPLYSENGELVLESRSLLTAEKIDLIKSNYGSFVYYTDNGERAVIPKYRLKTAYNSARSLMDEIVHSDKLSKKGYKEAEKVIEEILHDIHTVDIQSINLLKELTEYDEYLYNHSVNVGIMAAVMAKNLGQFNEYELKSLTMGAYLLDIGQKKIDKQLLDKEGKLDISEFQKMKRHPQLGYELVKHIDPDNAITLQSILFHHEKVNNKGYYQLPYEHLPIFPKIVSICDVFDALTSSRPFRKDPISGTETLKALVNSTDHFFDHNLISNFINIMTPLVNNSQLFYKTTDLVELNSSELALITEYNKKDILKPQVMIFCKFDRRKDGKLVVKYYDRPEYYNFSSNDKYINKIISNEKQTNIIKEKLSELKFIN